MFNIGDRVQFEGSDSNGFRAREFGTVMRGGDDQDMIQVRTDRGRARYCLGRRWTLVQAVPAAGEKFMAVFPNGAVQSGFSPFLGSSGLGSGVFETREALLNELAITSRRNPTTEYHIVPVRSVAKVVDGEIVERYN